MGIPRGELRRADVKRSMYEKYDDELETEKDISDIAFSQLIVISSNSKIYLGWRTINTMAALTSSYMYALMAAYPTAA